MVLAFFEGNFVQYNDFQQLTIKNWARNITVACLFVVKNISDINEEQRKSQKYFQSKPFFLRYSAAH